MDLIEKLMILFFNIMYVIIKGRKKVAVIFFLEKSGNKYKF